MDSNDGLPYVPLVPYNGTGPAGGDPMVNDLNVWYQVLPSGPTSPSRHHPDPFASAI